mmetsp:Transcript_6013/g.22772  ORF Transcript_6013/g.22772 Transcript_6013/m.22772 type:complete len:292 (-) Transcript_6013:349-1224(-)
MAEWSECTLLYGLHSRKPQTMLPNAPTSIQSSDHAPPSALQAPAITSKPRLGHVCPPRAWHGAARGICQQGADEQSLQASGVRLPIHGPNEVVPTVLKLAQCLDCAHALRCVAGAQHAGCHGIDREIHNGRVRLGDMFGSTREEEVAPAVLFERKDFFVRTVQHEEHSGEVAQGGLSLAQHVANGRALEVSRRRPQLLLNPRQCIAHPALDDQCEELGVQAGQMHRRDGAYGPAHHDELLLRHAQRPHDVLGVAQQGGERGAEGGVRAVAPVLHEDGRGQAAVLRGQQIVE